MEQVEHLLSSQNRVGEGPVWSAEENALYWVDIEQKRFHRLRLDTPDAQPETFEVGAMVGALALRQAGGVLLATQRGFAHWNFDTNQPVFGPDPEADLLDNRFNDAKPDALGRYWAGTMGLKPDVAHPAGSLYRLDPDGTVQRMETGLTISNGLGWNPDNTLMYLTDSPRHLIYVYDFDLAAGQISNRRVFVDTSSEPGEPDGLAVDSEGCVWSARWGGWKVSRYAPDGRLLSELKMPVECPSCCAFGGPNLDVLYITSAQAGVKPENLSAQPMAGDLFRFNNPGVRGLPVAKVGY